MSTDVPIPLYRLVKRIMASFYTPEVSLVMDLLVRKVVLNEDEMSEILRFDKKQLRQFLFVLRSDKFVKIKLTMETGDDGKASRQNYYFINYKEFVNSIKYKLDIVRKKIEQKERYATVKASYACSECKKTFSEFEIDRLMDFETQELRCTFCGGEVIEDNPQDDSGISRNILARFNEAMEPIFSLLREAEDIRLGAEHLDPEIRQKARASGPHVYDSSFSKGRWADKNKSVFGYSVDDELTVKIDKNAEKQATTKKEQPEWMKTSTIEGAANYEMKDDSSKVVNIMQAKEIVDNSNSTEISDSDEIVQLLIACEQPNEEHWSKIRGVYRFGRKPHVEFECRKRQWDWESDEYLDTFQLVSVSGKALRLIDINDNCIRMMSVYEREEYYKLGLQIHHSNFGV